MFRTALRLRSYPQVLLGGVRNGSTKVLVVGEHNGKTLSVNTLSAITAASKLGDVHLCLATPAPAPALVDSAKQVKGVEKVLTASSAAYANLGVENVAELIVKVQGERKYAAVVAGASVFGKSVMPRVAARLDVSQVSEVIAIKDPSTFVRPIYAGNALSTVKSNDAVKVLTVRPTSFDKAAVSGGSAAVEEVSATADLGLAGFKGASTQSTGRPDLSSASRVVSGGRGLKSKENFALIEGLADTLGAAVGASRAAVDAGYAPNDTQVGQTGKIVAPELYVAVGISGAIQHLAGMKDSKVIVAINKDKEAPIFQVADYGLVGDLFEVVPALQKAIQAQKTK